MYFHFRLADLLCRILNGASMTKSSLLRVNIYGSVIHLLVNVNSMIQSKFMKSNVLRQEHCLDVVTDVCN